MIDVVNHPPHYKSDSGIESIDVIERLRNWKGKNNERYKI